MVGPATSRGQRRKRSSRCGGWRPVATLRPHDTFTRTVPKSCGTDALTISGPIMNSGCGRDARKTWADAAGAVPISSPNASRAETARELIVRALLLTGSASSRRIRHARANRRLREAARATARGDQTIARVGTLAADDGAPPLVARASQWARESTGFHHGSRPRSRQIWPAAL